MFRHCLTGLYRGCLYLLEVCIDIEFVRLMRCRDLSIEVNLTEGLLDIIALGSLEFLGGLWQIDVIHNRHHFEKLLFELADHFLVRLALLLCFLHLGVAFLELTCELFNE